MEGNLGFSRSKKNTPSHSTVFNSHLVVLRRGCVRRRAIRVERLVGRRQGNRLREVLDGEGVVALLEGLVAFLLLLLGSRSVFRHGE